MNKFMHNGPFGPYPSWFAVVMSAVVWSILAVIYPREIGRLWGSYVSILLYLGTAIGIDLLFNRTRPQASQGEFDAEKPETQASLEQTSPIPHRLPETSFTHTTTWHELRGLSTEKPVLLMIFAVGKDNVPVWFRGYILPRLNAALSEKNVSVCVCSLSAHGIFRRRRSDLANYLRSTGMEKPGCALVEGGEISKYIPLGIFGTIDTYVQIAKQLLSLCSGDSDIAGKAS